MSKLFKLSTSLVISLVLFVSVSFASNIVKLNPEYFPNPSIGRALSGAQIYVGVVDLDPKIPANQKTVSVLQENGTTVAVTQPLTTGAGGVPLYNGSPVTMLVEGSYSLRVDDSTGSQIYYVPQNIGAENVDSYDSIADLRAITESPNDGQVVRVLGYDAATENQDWSFQWLSSSTTADNSGTIIKATSITTGRWIRLTENLYVSVKWFGAKGDSATDDTASIALAATYADTLTGSTLFFPENSTLSATRYVKTALTQLTTGVDIKGANKNVTIVCIASSGFEYVNQVIRTTVSDIGMGTDVRYTVTPHAYFGIKYNGGNGTSPSWNTINNVFFDGFAICVDMNWVWEQEINNVKAVFIGQFVKAAGISVSNRIQNSSAEGNGLLLDIGDGTNTCQGWFIDNNVFSSLNTGQPLRALGASFGFITNNIFDFVGPTTCILLQSIGSLGCFGWEIHNNYIAYSAAGTSGIRLLNSVAPGATLNTGNNVSGNQIFPYSGSTLTVGILIDGTTETNNKIIENTIEATTDISNAGSNSIIKDNIMLGGGCNTSVLLEYAGNVGTYSGSQTSLKQTNGNLTTYYAASIPTTGSYVTNDFVINLVKTVDGNNMILDGWHRATTGSAHVINVDWWPYYISATSPAN